LQKDILVLVPVPGVLVQEVQKVTQAVAPRAIQVVVQRVIQGVPRVVQVEVRKAILEAVQNLVHHQKVILVQVVVQKVILVHQVAQNLIATITAAIVAIIKQLRTIQVLLVHQVQRHQL
jgi:hypothetical protein